MTDTPPFAENVRKCAVEQGVAEEAKLAKGIAEKSKAVVLPEPVTCI
jgi:hypothetical protein